MSQPAQKVHLGVMVRDEQRRELAALARREDRSVSSVTRAAIDAYFASEHAQAAREGAAR
jgi:predicted transcriptional regulator